MEQTPIWTPSKHALLAMERAYGKNWRKIDWAMVEACKGALNPGVTALYFYDHSQQYHTDDVSEADNYRWTHKSHASHNIPRFGGTSAA